MEFQALWTAHPQDLLGLDLPSGVPHHIPPPLHRSMPAPLSSGAGQSGGSTSNLPH